MNAAELFLKDGRSAKVFYCEKCRIVHRTLEDAEGCCKPKLCKCGKELKNYYTLCDNCREELEFQREFDRFHEAKKVTSHDGWLYFEGLGGNDGFFESVSDILDECENEETDIPGYVWCCKSRPIVNVKADNILDRCVEDTYDGFDADRIHGVEELKKALKAFNDANKDNVLWEPDYTKALILDKTIVSEEELSK